MRAVTVIHQIADSLRQYPDNRAIQTPHGEYSYAQLEAKVSGLQSALREAGLPGNRLVGVLTGDHKLCYAAVLAILACGCAYVPINHRNPADRNSTILEDAGIDLVISHKAHKALEQATSSRASARLLQSTKVDPESRPLELPRISEDDLAYILYTSGSTGMPKGVPIRHRNLTAFMRVMLDPAQYAFSEHDRFLQMFELTFDPSIASFMTPLCIGASSHVIPERGVVSFNVIKVLQEQSITVALMVPSVMFYLQSYFDEICLRGLRYSLFCGEGLPNEILSQWRRCIPDAQVQNLYGPTEATVVILRYDWTSDIPEADLENGIVAIGKPFPNSGAFILDDSGRKVASGERGELCLTGPQVTDHYWQDIERSQESFVFLEGSAGPAYRTGDISYVNEHGNYMYCGRADQQIKIDGFRVELGEIEHHARNAANNANAAVVATSSGDGGAVLTLFLEDPDVSKEAVMANLQAKLPPHMLPRYIETVPELPLNSSGKVDRRALAEHASRI